VVYVGKGLGFAVPGQAGAVSAWQQGCRPRPWQAWKVKWRHRSGLFAQLTWFINLSAQRATVVWQLSKFQANMWNYFETIVNSAVKVGEAICLL